MGTLDKDVFDPNAKPLDARELDLAFRNNVCTHREFIKSHIDPPILGQTYALASYKFLDITRELKILPDGEPLYGWVKLRGNYATEEEAQKAAKDLLQGQDSKSKIQIYRVGGWTPLTSSTLLTKQFDEFSDQQWRQKMIDDKKKQEQQIKEIREREEQLKQGIDQYTEDSLDYYVMKKVTLAENQYTMDRAMKTLKETRKNINDLEKEIEELDSKYPDHKKNALEQYNKERREAGMEEVSSFNFKNLAHQN